MSELTRTTSLVIAWLSMQVIADAYVTSMFVYSDPRCLKLPNDNHQLP